MLLLAILTIAIIYAAYAKTYTVTTVKGDIETDKSISTSSSRASDAKEDLDWDE